MYVRLTNPFKSYLIHLSLFRPYDYPQDTETSRTQMHSHNTKHISLHVEIVKRYKSITVIFKQVLIDEHVQPVSQHWVTNNIIVTEYNS